MLEWVFVGTFWISNIVTTPTGVQMLPPVPVVELFSTQADCKIAAAEMLLNSVHGTCHAVADDQKANPDFFK